MVCETLVRCTLIMINKPLPMARQLNHGMLISETSGVHKWAPARSETQQRVRVLRESMCSEGRQWMRENDLK